MRGTDAVVNLSAEPHGRPLHPDASPFLHTQWLGTPVFARIVRARVSDKAFRPYISQRMKSTASIARGAPLKRHSWILLSPILPASPAADQSRPFPLSHFCLPVLINARPSTTPAPINTRKIPALFITHALRGPPRRSMATGGNLRELLHVSIMAPVSNGLPQRAIRRNLNIGTGPRLPTANSQLLLKRLKPPFAGPFVPTARCTTVAMPCPSPNSWTFACQPRFLFIKALNDLIEWYQAHAPGGGPSAPLYILPPIHAANTRGRPTMKILIDRLWWLWEEKYGSFSLKPMSLWPSGYPAALSPFPTVAGLRSDGCAPLYRIITRENPDVCSIHCARFNMSDVRGNPAEDASSRQLRLLPAIWPLALPQRF